MKKILIIIFLIFFYNPISSPKTKIVQTENNLLYFIGEWINTPYRFGGTSKSGIDCSAFVRKLFKDVYDLNLPRTAYRQFKVSKRIKKKDLEKGDLIFFKSYGTNPWHVGMYLGSDYFIHSSIKFGVTVSCLTDLHYQRIYYAAGRILQ